MHLHGREAEIDRIVELARRRQARCVTITGIRGIGKSRVLHDARRRLGAEDPSLSFIDDAAPESLGAATGALVIAAAPLPLGAPGEQEVHLGPLGPAAASLVADAARWPPSAEHGDDVAAALGRLVAASDGHPVALEQVAGWLALLSPRDATLALDAGEISLLPAAFARRLRRARAALAPNEREVLGALAELGGSLDLRALRAAVRARMRPDLPRIVMRLTAGGWLVREGSPAAPRSRVLAPFAAIARGRTTGAYRRRLTAHFAERARPIFESAVTDRACAAGLLEDRGELVRAWEDARRRRDPAEVPLAVALSVVAWSGEPAASLHVERIRRTIAAHPRAPRRGRLEIAWGDALWFAGDARGADGRFVRAARLARRERDAAVEAFAWIRRATLGPELGDLDVAQRHLTKGMTLAATCNEPRVTILATGIRGYLFRARGDARAAVAAFDEQAALAARAGDTFYRGVAEAYAADAHLALGELALGRVRYERALRAVARVDPGWARTIEGLMGLAAWEAVALAEAASLLGRAQASGQTPRFRAVFAAAHAGVLAELGEVGAATRALGAAEDASHGEAPSAARPAIQAATLLVARARASDAASAAAIRRRIERHLALVGPSIAEEERAFTAALRRATSSVNLADAALPAEAFRRRPRLARVYAVLADHGSRGEEVSASALFEAAWPRAGDVDVVVASARVRKAVSLLRRLGLRGAIVTTDGGYRLVSPEVGQRSAASSSVVAKKPRLT